VVLVVGPSGAGKDAILRAVRERLAGDTCFEFPRRIVTREGNVAEDHIAVMPKEFDDLVRRGTLAVHWQAHGLKYGISAEIDRSLRAGGCVLFNASRTVVPIVRARYANTAIALVDAPLALRVTRLAARDREAAHEIAARLSRIVSGTDALAPDLVIDNDGALEHAADLLARWLQERAGVPDRSRTLASAARCLPGEEPA
jgi:phosphonate metabolism protein PhnN/1,5-bisphosphokinase (PRPP-forming)